MLLFHVVILSTLVYSNMTAGSKTALSSHGDTQCSPPEISDITFDAVLIGRVNSRKGVVSELQCMDTCVRWPSCIAYTMETAGSIFRCTTLATVERIEKKPGSLYRRFDREKIEKFLFQSDDCDRNPDEKRD